MEERVGAQPLGRGRTHFFPPPLEPDDFRALSKTWTAIRRKSGLPHFGRGQTWRAIRSRRIRLPKMHEPDRPNSPQLSGRRPDRDCRFFPQEKSRRSQLSFTIFKQQFRIRRVGANFGESSNPKFSVVSPGGLMKLLRVMAPNNWTLSRQPDAPHRHSRQIPS